MNGLPSFERWRPHPWHGLAPGNDPPRLLNAYIEITPFDPVKYEIDKVTGYLRADRPQRSSSLPPAPYGFIPRTYCGPRVAALSPEAAQGDGDPLDICVLSERPITRSEVLLTARVVGGLHQIDHDAADDKIIAVLDNDNVWGAAADIADIPERLVERLRHYFATYKLVPGAPSPVMVQEVYGVAHAERVVTAAMEDYQATFKPNL
ncbi:MAG: inorganic pyrophosphatase [Pseudomonadota bacterium]|nr:inorganic pyrophosphatase [Pseudomonadota bacterium]